MITNMIKLDSLKDMKKMIEILNKFFENKNPITLSADKSGDFGLIWYFEEGGKEKGIYLGCSIGGVKLHCERNKEDMSVYVESFDIWRSNLQGEDRCSLFASAIHKYFRTNS